ncbi:hypothetical protein BDQ94DRAFT_151174 [Aspergillus welwitschiae]|uniref:Uncharacterized protein n=1 Tax=Aspergillus welwitschiae TaxID=1341132 RepID=A0A3F3PQ13_9EURO|nr:hypothetical protein BDQ94DRAFT_151174 [Aspergillus welwitschiae]RDH28994.1 hypothetical protein BDQ94DRAFT_151174 [Aspergillus welwitschiae]
MHYPVLIRNDATSQAPQLVLSTHSTRLSGPFFRVDSINRYRLRIPSMELHTKFQNSFTLVALQFSILVAGFVSMIQLKLLVLVVNTHWRQYIYPASLRNSHTGWMTETSTPKIAPEPCSRRHNLQFVSFESLPPPLCAQFYSS